MQLNWTELVTAYLAAEIELPTLKPVTLAQWALESGWGKSRLAQDHNNFAGLKYRARMRDHAKPVDYVASDGIDTYCKFASIEDFIEGYWHFIDSGPYTDWKNYDDNPIGYIRYIWETGYAGDKKYVSKVRDLLDDVEEQIDAIGGKNGMPPPGGGEEPKTTKVAVVVGHNRKRRGAYSDHLRVSEWIFNQRVAEYMEQNSGDMNLKIKTFLRTPGGGYEAEIDRAYRKVNSWEPALVIELHFNAGGGRGTEMLHWHKSTDGKVFAEDVQAEVLDVLELRDRGLKSRKRGDRGWRSLVAARAPCILAEPFFGDSKRDSTKMMNIGEKRLARAYLRGLRRASDSLDL